VQTKWKVRYVLATAVEVDEPVPSYPILGLDLYYSGKKLTQVEHTITAEDTASHDDLIVLSDRNLRLFWEWLEYKRCAPIRISNRTTGSVAPVPGDPATGGILLEGAYVIALPINMPTETALTNAQLRLAVWLRLTNEARHTASDVEAVRNYFAIWEEIKGSPKSIPFPWSKEVQLKYTRHFVSHGEPLTKDKHLLDFLQRKLGHPVNQYDLHQPCHQALVKEGRAMAQSLIETELKKLL
jgi:hypothetical protein